VVEISEEVSVLTSVHIVRKNMNGTRLHSSGIELNPCEKGMSMNICICRVIRFTQYTFVKSKGKEHEENKDLF